MLGVRVKIMPPDAQFPDKIKIVTELPPEETQKITTTPITIKTPPTPPQSQPEPEPVPEETIIAQEITDEPTPVPKEKTREAKK
jgi:hypothetical protein